MSAVGVLCEVLNLLLYTLTHIVTEFYYFLTRSRPLAKLQNERVLITGSAQGKFLLKYFFTFFNHIFIIARPLFYHRLMTF